MHGAGLEGANVEADTTKLPLRGRETARITSSSIRLSDLQSLRTQKVGTSLDEASAIKLFTQLHDFLAVATELHEARNLDSLYRTGIAAVSHLFDLRYHQMIEREAGGDYKQILSKSSSPPPHELEGFSDLIAWASKARQVMLYEIEEGRTGEVCTIGIVPVLQDPTRHCVMLIWLADPISDMNVLQMDVLQTFGMDMAARATALLQRARLEDLSSLFDNIIESVPQAVIAISADDRVMALNANAEFLFEIKRIFVMDEPYSQVFPAPLVKTFRMLINQSLMGEEVADAEIEHKLADGVSVNIGVSVTFLRDRDGKPRGHLFLCRDLSLSREVQKLREVDRMKSEFVNTVSHELKTPLTAILGGLEILDMEKDGLSEDFLEILGVVNDGAQRLRSLIFDLLDVARLESGRVALREERTTIAEVIGEGVKVQQQHPNHTIVTEVAEGLPIILADRAKLIQCVTNYISNAIKYSPRGGKVTVRSFIQPEDNALVISVGDEGVGI